MAKSFYKRLQQSQQDRTLVTIKYRCKGDSKDRVVTMQRCKVRTFKEKLTNLLAVPIVANSIEIDATSQEGIDDLGHKLEQMLLTAIKEIETKFKEEFGDKSPIGEATCYQIHTTRQFLCRGQFVVTAQYRWGRKSIQWQDPKHSMPDADIDVLLNTTNKSCPVWPGHWNGEEWVWCEGYSVLAAEHRVIAWAEMPEGPNDGDE